MILKLLFIGLLIVLFNEVKCHMYKTIDFGYHNYDNMTEILRNFSFRFPDITHLYSIGKSVEGRELWVLAIAESQPEKHLILRPEVKYVGTQHGHEIVTQEILLHFIDYVLNCHEMNLNLSYLVKNTRIHILPNLNPDGFNRAVEGDCDGNRGRNNSNNYDLNRNFPDLFECNSNTPIQPETRAYINWMENNTFILSGNLHSGALVVNYPFDNYINGSSSGIAKASVSDDDEVFRHLAITYSYNHLKMRNATCNNETFSDGITNGAEWLPIQGGMQDFNYWSYGCIDLTFEISCCRYPPANELSQFWTDNKYALLEYLKQANTGVKGVVTYANGQPAENLSVRIGSREPAFKTNEHGEFYRILLPGNYTFILMFNCDHIYHASIRVPDDIKLLTFNITLSNDLYDISKSYTLSKYPIFCAQEVLECVNNNKDIYAHKVTQNKNEEPHHHAASGSNRSIYLSVLYFVYSFIFSIFIASV